jgi:hypothetical protein
VDNVDAEPRSEEGQRRLRFFANSLFMEMPEAKPVRQMHSFSISTPYFNEIVLYSVKELTAQNDDCIKLLYYLQTINPFEWENFLERLTVKDMNEALKKYPEEVQLWASYRGQTLARTVRGMMYNEEAIRFLYWLEIGENEPMHLVGCTCNRCQELDEMVALKFSYVRLYIYDGSHLYIYIYIWVQFLVLFTAFVFEGGCFAVASKRYTTSRLLVSIQQGIHIIRYRSISDDRSIDVVS